MSLSFSGSTITMSVDDGADVVVEDSDIPSGAVGLAMNGAAGSFDNVAVY